MDELSRVKPCGIAYDAVLGTRRSSMEGIRGSLGAAYHFVAVPPEMTSPSALGGSD